MGVLLQKLFNGKVGRVKRETFATENAGFPQDSGMSFLRCSAVFSPFENASTWTELHNGIQRLSLWSISWKISYNGVRNGAKQNENISGVYDHRERILTVDFLKQGLKVVRRSLQVFGM